LGEILSEICGDLNLSPRTEAGRQRILGNLSNFQACCKGIQSNEWDSENRGQPLSALQAESPGFLEFRRYLIEILTRCIDQYAGDVEVVNGVCSLMDLCIRSTTPPLLFTQLEWLSPFQNMIQHGLLQVSSVLDVVGSLLCQTSPLLEEIAQLLTTVIGTMLVHLSSNQGIHSREQPELVDGFLTLLSLTLRNQIVFFYTLPHLKEIVHYATDCLQLKERTSLKASVHFLVFIYDFLFPRSS
jgi:hypothetical protein